MYCPNCNKEFASGKFCPECGTMLVSPVVANWCPNCNKEFSSGKFCPECGSPLVPKPAAHVGPAPNHSSTNPSGGQRQNTDLFEEARNFEFGNGRPQDIASAAQLYLQAAEGGNPDAMCHIGYLMLFGYGIERHTRDAVYWLQSGLNQSSNPNSIYCRNAQVVLKNLNKAPFPFQNDEIRWNSLKDKIAEYNKLADASGYMALSVVNGVLVGSGIDGMSLYSKNENQQQHFISFAKVHAGNAGGNNSFFGKYKQAFTLGRLEVQFAEILRESLALGID